MPSIVKTKSHNNENFALIFKTTKRLKREVACSQELSTHHHQLWKVLSPSTFSCRNPTLAKCKDETHTPKVGDLESSGTLEFLEFDNKAQNTSHWGVLGVIGKVLKRRCLHWSFGHMQFKLWAKEGSGVRALKVDIRPLPDIQF
jgi:hypothetical protein